MTYIYQLLLTKTCSSPSHSHPFHPTPPAPFQYPPMQERRPQKKGGYHPSFQFFRSLAAKCPTITAGSSPRSLSLDNPTRHRLLPEIVRLISDIFLLPSHSFSTTPLYPHQAITMRGCFCLLERYPESISLHQNSFFLQECLFSLSENQY